MTAERKADFLVIGAMKAATSTVCAYLEDHPDVYMVPGGEPNYFSHDENFARGPAWYAEHFAPRSRERLCGEGSNDYAARDLYPDSAARMAAYNPDLKLIYMVRHPLERIASAWLQNRKNRGDSVPPTLDQAVREMPARFVGQSRYWHNIAPYRERFSDGRIFVGFMEDLGQDPAGFFDGLCGFLGVEPFRQPETGERQHLNKSIGKRVPTRAFSAVNRLPFMRAAKRILPKGLKSTVKSRLLTSTVSEMPELSPAVRAEVLRVIEPDARAFLSHYGKPADFWTFT